MLKKQQCNLSAYSTFGIGGPARYLIEIKTKEDLLEALRFAKNEELPVLPLGKGSNSLFDDRGFDGIVLYNKIDHITFNETTIAVGGGASFSLLGAKASRLKLGGLEFASGIPGSVGGAIFMNAGANGYETKDVLKQVVFMTLDGEERIFDRNELVFSYRTSPFQKLQGIIVEATFQLWSEKDARDKQKAIVEYRIKTQPYKTKSAGCAFRNPEGYSAGQLIEKAGLKGYRVGGAQVSERHANFIINSGGATAEDVVKLVAHIRETVHKKTGIILEDELRRIPYTIKKCD